MISTSTIYGAVGAIILVYLLDAYFCRRKHPQEPVCARPTIPLIGHGLGMMMHGSKYYEIISPGQPEVFTLPILSFRLYIVKSRHLFPVVMRNARTLSFQPFVKIASKVWCDVSDEFMEMHEEGHPWVRDMFRDTRTSLAPGPALDYQNMMTGESLLRVINALAADGDGDMEIYSWVKHLISVAATDGVYGKNNPFRDASVENDFWIWHDSVKKMMVKMPRIFLKKDLEARDRFFKAFEAYLSSDISDAAEVTQIRKRLNHREGVGMRDAAAFQASFNIALLGNTVPTAFWSLYDIISRPQLLAEIRAEVEEHAITKDATTFVLDVAALRTQCPLLLSSYQESQRTRSIHANIRQVMSDTVIESPTSGAQFFFAKGNYIQMPSGPIHKDGSIWGPTAGDFDAHRFAANNAVTRKGESYAFMPWGSAPHLCPARQFASTELMLFIALMVVRFELAPGRGEKEFRPLKIDQGALNTMMPPKEEVFVSVRRREGWQGEWQLKMGDSSKRIPLASG